VAFLVFAVCLVFMAFEVIQMFARRELKLHTVRRAEVIRMLNDLAPYIGKDVEVLDIVVSLLTDSTAVTEEEEAEMVQEQSCEFGESNHGGEDSQEKTYQEEEESAQEQTREFGESNHEGESTNLEAGKDSQEKTDEVKTESIEMNVD